MALVAGQRPEDIESGRLTKDDIMALASFHGIETPDFHNLAPDPGKQMWLGRRMAWVIEHYKGKVRLSL